MVTENGGLYFHVKEGSFKGADIADFLRSLLYYFRKQKLLIIWDGAKQHFSQEVKDFLENESKGRIFLQRQPSYSPELNADEQAHGYIKQNILANRLFTKSKDLKAAVEDGYQWLKENSYLVYNFFFHEDLGFHETSSA